MLAGKGMWIWEPDKTEADPAKMVRLAKAAGLQHVIIKLADGEFSYPLPAKDPDGSKERLTHDLIQAFRKAGMVVWGWAFAYGSGVDIEMQAHRLAGRVMQFKLGGVVINAEDFGQRRWSSAGGELRARRYMETLQQDLNGVEGGVLYALSSYRFMSSHNDFPFDAFMHYCDIAMPQVYWVTRGSGDALRNLQDSYSEYQAAFPKKLYVPTGAAYGEYYGSGRSRFYWSATPEQMTIFLNQAKALGLPAVNFWSWQHARNDHENLWFSGTQLWDTIARYPYDVSEPDDVVTGQPSDAVSVEREIHVGQGGYFDGVYAGMPNSRFDVFVRGGRKMKYARTSASRSGVWAAWLPALSDNGRYEISAWVPGLHGTSKKARYYVHGVVGQPSALTVELNQRNFYDRWVPLGIYDLDANHPQSGMVNLTNLTGESGQELAFAGIRWRRLRETRDSDEIGRGESGDYVADGFDPPVGTRDERHGDKVWPGQWFDATGFGTRYYDSGGSRAYHTGADLNLNKPSWNVDAGMPVFAVASGVVTFAESKRVWGNIVIVRHDPLKQGGAFVYSRSAHLDEVNVVEGQRLQRGDLLGTVGKPTRGTEHLHFDIGTTEAMYLNPGDWPGLDWSRLRRDYVNPKTFIMENRPRRS